MRTSQRTKAILKGLLASALVSAVFLPGKAQAALCSSVVGERPVLSRAQEVAIADLSKGVYETSVQRLTVKGKERLVVFVGEEHIKTPEDAERFRKLMVEFRFHGSEGIDFNASGYWFAQDIKRLLGLVYGDRSKKSEGSSLNMTALRADTQAMENLILQQYLAYIREGKLSVADAEAILNQANFRSDFANRLISGKISDDPNFARSLSDSLDIAKITELLREQSPQNAAAPNQPKQEMIADTVRFQLETGYRPSLREKIGGATAVIALKAIENRWCSKAICVATAGGYFMTRDGSVLLAGAVGLLTAKTALFKIIKRGFDQVGPLEPRNEFMVENLLKTLAKENDVDKIVVTVGAHHLPGMVQLLQARGATTEPLSVAP